STFGSPSDKLRGPPSAPQSSHPNIIGCSAQTHSSTSVHSPAIHLMTLGVNIAAVCRLETLTALVLNDHAYDKLTLKEESYGARSTPVPRAAASGVSRGRSRPCRQGAAPVPSL